MNAKNVGLVFACVGLASIRFFMPSHAVSLPGSYEALAHLFVGGLIGAWLATWRKLYLVLAAVMSVVELVAFLTIH